ncbi:hypothetical protein HK104_002979 [Borealophlyctis nickersoniae]|nr:hypothetical protein HK104_002979 [Borealophlyctis nickersoniae]
MANPLSNDPTVEDADDEYVASDEVAEVVDMDDEGEPMSEDEEVGDMGMEPEQEGEGAQEAVMVDDSVQGFFDHRESVFAVAIHPTEEMLVMSGGGDDKSYLWRLDNGEKMFDLGVHTDSVSAVGFSHDGQFAASGGMDGKVHVFNVATGQLAVTLEGPTDITWIDWHPKGNVLLAGSEDATTWMWSVPSGTCMAVFTGHADSVTCGQFTPDGKTVVTGSVDGTVISWNPKTAGAQLRMSSEDQRFHNAPVTSLAVHKDNLMVLTGAQDGTARLIHIGNGRILASLDNHSDSIETIGFCNTMPLAATGSVDGTISIWDITSMRLRHTLRHDDAVTKIVWHATSPFLTSVSTDRTVRLWDARTGECLKLWRGHLEAILDVAVTRDGGKIVTGSDDGTVLVFSGV